MRFQLLFCLFIFYVSYVFGQETIPLNDALSLTECKVSEYASSIEYIPLEDSKECLLSNELNVVVAAQDIFVHDIKENKVFRFDKAGKFMNLIGKRGLGPGEYNRIFGIYADDATQECFLLEPFSNRINVYDYNGTFKRSIHVECAPTRMMKLGDNYVLNHSMMDINKYELTLINSVGKTIKQSNQEGNQKVGLSFSFPVFYTSGGNVFYKNYISEYIYLLDNNLKRKKVYWFDLGDKAINSEENQYDLKKGSLTKGKLTVGTLSAYKDWLFIPYGYDKGRFLLYIIQLQRSYLLQE